MPLNATISTRAFKGQHIHVDMFGAIGDGSSHPLSERYATLALAQADYPFAAALADEIDWCAIQAAIEASKSTNYTSINGYAVVHFAAKKYFINRSLNCTDRAFQPLRLCGQGMSQLCSEGTTVLICDTGSWCIDLTGSSYVCVENMTLFAAPVDQPAFAPDMTTPAVGGILIARSTTSLDTGFAQFNRLHRVYVFLDTTPAANGGEGTIGFYNQSAEHFTCDDCYFIADCPAVLTGANNLSVASDWVTIGGFESMTFVTMRQVGMRAWTQAGLRLWEARTVNLDMCYFSRQPASTAEWAIESHSNCANIAVIGGQVEEFPALWHAMDLTSNLEVRITVVEMTSPYFELDANLGRLDNCTIALQHLNGTEQALSNDAVGTWFRCCQIHLSGSMSINAPTNCFLYGCTVFIASNDHASVVAPASSNYTLSMYGKHEYVGDHVFMPQAVFRTLAGLQGRVGQDTTGLYLSADDAGKVVRFLTESAEAARISTPGGFYLKQGYGALPDSANEVRVGSNGSTPNGVSVCFGDGSGWRLNFGAKVAAAFVRKFSIYDTGVLRLVNDPAIHTYTGDPNANVAESAIGSLCIDYTSGILYIKVHNTPNEFYGWFPLNLPDPTGNGKKFVQVNDGGTGYELDKVGLEDQAQVTLAGLSANRILLKHATEDRVAQAGALSASTPMVATAGSLPGTGPILLGNANHVSLSTTPGNYLYWDGSVIQGADLQTLLTQIDNRLNALEAHTHDFSMTPTGIVENGGSPAHAHGWTGDPGGGTTGGPNL